ncbi:MAG TPA: hypothetical protein VG897_06725, partial [Terriglobales bacterium]|nr:hypothetical protein [Terriglobales bacterium]
ISDQIPFCGGLPPVVTTHGDRVDVELPGTTELEATRHWQYEGGHVYQLASTTSGRPDRSQ